MHIPSTNILILAIPAAMAFVLCLQHSLRFRGNRITVAFFSAIVIFGYLRGNLVHLITKGRPPYSFSMNEPILAIGNVGIVETMGWTLALYLSWCVAERILWRRERIGDNVFSVVLATAGIITLFSIMMESAAGAMGWWNWTPPKGMSKSPMFRDVERGLAAWFSVGFDFFLPWMLLANAKLKRRWLGLFALAIFPFHFGMHAVRHTHLFEHLIKAHHLAHFVMYAGAALLALTAYAKIANPADFSLENRRRMGILTSRMDLIALAIVIGTVMLGLTFKAGQGELVLFSLPLTAAGFWGLLRTEISQPEILQKSEQRKG